MVRGEENFATLEAINFLFQHFSATISVWKELCDEGTWLFHQKKSNKIKLAKHGEKNSQFPSMKDNVIVYLVGWIKCTRMNIQNINIGLDGDPKA